tara:strand:+ start:2585 stop:2938 length:354 start_codon:yes stop_codon:yes gene_type:complete
MKDNTGFMIVMCIVVLFFMFVYQASGGEWNDKPIMCEQKKIALEAIKSKGEVPVANGVQSAKVHGSDGLAAAPVHIGTQLYVNFVTKTWSILEYHPSYNSICIIAYGDKFERSGKKL